MGGTVTSGALTVDLLAYDAVTGELIPTFLLAPVLILPIAPGAAVAGIAYFGPDGSAHALASVIDVAHRTVSAAVPHFSPFGTTGNGGDLTTPAGPPRDVLVLSAPPGHLLLHSSNNTFDDLSFAPPSGTLLIDLGGGDDDITIEDISAVTLIAPVIRGGRGPKRHYLKGPRQRGQPECDGQHGLGPDGDDAREQRQRHRRRV